MLRSTHTHTPTHMFIYINVLFSTVFSFYFRLSFVVISPQFFSFCRSLPCLFLNLICLYVYLLCLHAMIILFTLINMTCRSISPLFTKVITKYTHPHPHIYMFICFVVIVIRNIFSAAVAAVCKIIIGCFVISLSQSVPNSKYGTRYKCTSAKEIVKNFTEFQAFDCWFL